MNTVLNSIINCVKDEEPWPHYTVHNLFDNDILEWIRNYPYPTDKEVNESEVDRIMLDRSTKGMNPILHHLKRSKEERDSIKDKTWHKKVHNCEINFGTSLREKYKEAKLITDYFTDIRVAEELEKISNVSLKDNFVRVQLLKDMPGIDIPLHTDIATKSFTLLAYFKTEDHPNLELGTQLYDGKVFVKRVLYKENCGSFFFPVQRRTETQKPTIHAFKDTYFEKPRISMIINFFNKSELALDIPGTRLGHYLPFKAVDF